MKGKLWKKLCAGVLALLIVSGGVPMQPIADMAREFSVMASADEAYITTNENVTTALKWSGNYTVTEDVTISGTAETLVSITGDTTITIAAGKTLTVNGIIEFSNNPNSGKTFTINGPGNLIVGTDTLDNYAIGGLHNDDDPDARNNIVIDNNANVTAINNCAALPTIFFRTGYSNAGRVTVNNGSLNVTNHRSYTGYGIYGDVTLNGGTFAMACIKSGVGGTFTISEGKCYKDLSNNYYWGELTSSEIEKLNNTTLTYDPNAYPITTVTPANGILNVGKASQSGQTVTITANPYESYISNALTVTKEGGGEVKTTKVNNTTYTFIMPECSVNVSVECTDTINSTEDWQRFCNILESYNTGIFTGRTVKLGADISITDMAGSDEHPFTGSFDGQGHTLTVAFNNNTTCTAPFYYVSNCSFRDLHIKGTIDVSEKKAAGIASLVEGDVTIRNCRSSVVIRSSYNGTGSNGGIVSHVLSGSLSIQGCVFDGKILLGSYPNYCCGFVGYKNKKSELSITDSIYDPAAIESDEVEVSNNCYTFVRNGSAGTNCYYTRTLGTEQGKAARTISAGQGVTVDLSGTATEYSVSGITAYENNNGLKYGNTIYAGNGDDVLFTLGCSGAPQTYFPLNVTVNGTAATKADYTHYSFTMPDEDVTVSATLTTYSEHFSQDGDTYTIHDETGWDIFCDCLQDNDTYNRFSGKTVELEKDITVSRMAGSSGHDFMGTFDGQRHTLTVSYGSADSPIDEDKAAPFCNVETGCNIKNLHTAGTIYTSKKYAGGIVGTQYGTVKIENCRSSVTIKSSTSGDGTHGGIVGHNGNSASAKLTIDGCVFDGKILSVGTTATTYCAGFVGYKANDGTVTITNSVYAPAALENGETEIASGATFVRNGSAGTNCYYTRSLGDAQGKAAYTITPGEDVTLDISGNATEYNVSGINVYSSGIEYAGNFYAGSGDTVALTLEYTGTPEVGYTWNGFTASAGTLNDTTLTMPAENVTVTAAIEAINYNINITQPANGSVSATVGGIANAATAHYGDTVTLTITPNAGYEVKSVYYYDMYYNENEVEPDEGVYSFVMPDEDVTVTAELDVESYFDGETSTLYLKGTILNSNVGDIGEEDEEDDEYEVGDGIILPEGVTKISVKHIKVDPSGATLPQNSSYLFHFKNVRSIDLRGADTSNVTNMYGMFSGCRRMTKLDLSSFDTRNVTDMENMFKNCMKLTTIYVSDKWSTGSVIYSEDMFDDCDDLIGGNGTACDGKNNIDANYAVIDRPGQPGYLTGIYRLTLPDNVTATPVHTTVDGVDYYAQGETITLSAKAGSTLPLVTVTSCGAPVAATGRDDGKYAFTMPGEDAVVTLTDSIGARLEGYSISLGDDIGVNFYMELADNVINSENAKMIFTIPNTGETTQDEIRVSDIVGDETRCVTVNGKTYYIFPCHVAAKEMTSAITAQIVYSENGEIRSSAVYTYSVKQYADYIIDHPNKYDAETVELAEAMLYYGGEAQRLLIEGVTDEELASNDLGYDTPDIPDVNTFQECDLTKIRTEGLTLTNISLILESKTSLRLYFKKSGDDAMPVLKDESGKVYSAKQKGSEYYYDITGFGAGSVFEKRNVMFTTDPTADFVAANAFEVCIGNYAKWAVTRSDPILVSTVTALYNYDKAAKAYKNKNNGSGKGGN